MDAVHEHLTRQVWLVAFKGEAGSGKSTLSRALSRRLRWPVIDKDDIRDLLDDSTPGLSYAAAHTSGWHGLCSEF